jgi:5-methylcytosine-specific restriction endonuclease McrA
MNWEKLRLQVLERDGFVCQFCGKTNDRLEIHHKVPKRKGGLDMLENLISYCRKCHKIIEPPTKMGYPNKVTYGYMVNVKKKHMKHLMKLVIVERHLTILS